MDFNIGKQLQTFLLNYRIYKDHCYVYRPVTLSPMVQKSRRFAFGRKSCDPGAFLMKFRIFNAFGCGSSTIRDIHKVIQDLLQELPKCTRMCPDVSPDHLCGKCKTASGSLTEGWGLLPNMLCTKR